MEAKLVAEKSAKIRDWVSHKVQEVIVSHVSVCWQACVTSTLACVSLY